MEAGSLLESTSVQLERVDPVPARGTRFEITFVNRDGLTPTSKLKELSVLLADRLLFGRHHIRSRKQLFQGLFRPQVNNGLCRLTENKQQQ